MKVRVLGSAAGGGVPQWNCACPNCADARAGREVLARTQSSVAVTADGERWVLLNASPDLRAQVESFPPLQPRALRGSGIEAVVLTDAEIDHTAGLLLLREGGELPLYSTPFVRDALTGSGLLETLGAYLHVRWTELQPGEAMHLRGRDDGELGIEIEAFEVPGDAPLYHQANGRPGAERGQVVGLNVRAPGQAAGLVYVPGAGRAERGLIGRIGPQDVLLWDGTFWSDDELVRLGISERTATAMGHLPLAGPGGSLDVLRDVRAARKVFVHVNNTNPVLREGSPERRAAEAEGWEVAFDGMELGI